MADRLDAEEWKAIVDPALATMQAAVGRHGGTVAQLLGDGLLAFFGAPAAHEDDPVRAVAAALDMVASLRPDATGRSASASPPRAPTSAGTEIRIGINTGEVVVGEVGGGGRHEYLAVGSAVNVAARLQAAARPGTILASANTYAGVQLAVEARAVGGLTLKGISELVDAFEIVGLRAGRGREWRTRPDIPTFGRERELRCLADVATRLRTGAGSIVWIVGEPGIGKTRLLGEWRVSVAGEVAEPEPCWVEAACLPSEPDRPLHLARAWTRELLGAMTTAWSGAPGDARAAIDAVAPGLRGSDDAAAVLARLLELPLTASDEAALAGLDARAVQHRTARALRALVEAVADLRPLILVAEDLHWIDPSSAELLTAVVPAAAGHPLAICLTSRPVDGGGASQRVAIAAAASLPAEGRLELQVEPLDGSAQGLLAAAMLGLHEVPESVRSAVLVRCEGNPLFVGALIDGLRERGLLRRQDGAWTVDPAGLEAMPLDLQGLLVSRLDALPGEGRRIAQIGSVAGRVAPVAVVAAAARDAGDVDAAEALLAGPGDGPGGTLGWNGGGLLVRAGENGGELAFAHALVRDAAYSMLPHAERRRLHGIVGRILEHEAEQAGRVGEESVTLAHHFANAGEHASAHRYAVLGAERAEAMYANAEAIALYDLAEVAARALLAARIEAAADEAAGTDGAVAERATLADVMDAHGRVLWRIGRFADAVVAFTRAADESPPDDRLRIRRARTAAGAVEVDRHDYEAAATNYAAAEALLDDVPPSGGPPEAAEPWWEAWIDLRLRRAYLAYWTGEVSLMGNLMASLEGPVQRHGTPAQRADYYDHQAWYLQRRDLYVPSDDVMRLKLVASTANRERGDRRSFAWDEFTLGFTYLWNLDLEAAHRHLSASLVEAGLIGDALLESRSTAYLSVVLRRQGRVSETREMAERAIAAARTADQLIYVAYGLANRGWSSLHDGETGRADLVEAARLFVLDPEAPFRWLALWPLIAIDAADGRTAEALRGCRALFEPNQQPPAGPVAEALDAVFAAANNGGTNLAGALAEAVARAREHVYL